MTRLETTKRPEGRSSEAARGESSGLDVFRGGVLARDDSHKPDPHETDEAAPATPDLDELLAESHEASLPALTDVDQRERLTDLCECGHERKWHPYVGRVASWPTRCMVCECLGFVLSTSNQRERPKGYICPYCHHALVLHEIDEDWQRAACCVEGCRCGHLADSNQRSRREA